ncbi:MAG: BPSL0761 family protein [Giesbergeria sp.]|nr:BPSL0761 family protein [Giesbergeria sp.]
MTMPSERARALMSAAEFLQELRLGTDTPAAIRAQAISVLRHFPETRSIEQEAERQLHRQQESGQSSWLLPVDYYERPKQ